MVCLNHVIWMVIYTCQSDSIVAGLTQDESFDMVKVMVLYGLVWFGMVWYGLVWQRPKNLKLSG